MDVGQITCTCGALLVEDVSDKGVRPVGATQTMRFQRATDFVMCESCLKTYDVHSLILLAHDRDTIAYLERWAAVAGGKRPEGPDRR